MVEKRITTPLLVPLQYAKPTSVGLLLIPLQALPLLVDGGIFLPLYDALSPSPK